jgi:hypothetical protein
MTHIRTTNRQVHSEATSIKTLLSVKTVWPRGISSARPCAVSLLTSSASDPDPLRDSFEDPA